MSIATSLTALATAKTNIANAITAKGGTVNSGDGMSDFSTDIGTIPTGVDTSDATAVAADILATKTAYVNGSKVTGSMTNRGTVNITPGTTNQTIAQGYHSGSGVVSGDADLVTSNIKSGANIFGVAGTASVVNTSDANAVAGDIASGKTAYVNGTKLTGTKTHNMVNLVNSVAWTGSYASSLNSLNQSVGCNASGEIQIVQQGVASTNYENIVFTLESAPSGVTLKGSYSTTPSASNLASQMYGCIIQGLTGPADLTFYCNTYQATYDYYSVAITVSYA